MPTTRSRRPRVAEAPALRRPGFALALLAALVAPHALRAQARIDPPPRYAGVASALARFIADQMAEKALPALSIALVDDQRIVWARGFGYANPADSTPATAETPYRVASVSKLFTDIGVMQLVERGALALDTPVTAYLTDFSPQNPSGQAITLREMLSHRAGIVREPPVGHYFDPTSPTLAATVGSLNTTSLVYTPGTQTKYSNAAIAAAGYVLERTQRTPFADYMARAVLRPLGMASSSFAPDSATVARRARGMMWTVDGRTFGAPTFPLGIGPASELTTTMLDLGRFLSALFAGGQGVDGRVLQPRTLDAMWGVQFGGPGAQAGYGLGFAISRLEGRLRIGHSGWHYGFATEVAALPSEKLGVAVSTTVDAANAVTERIADEALRLLVAAQEGRALPALVTTAPIPAETARRLEGRYRSATRTVDLSVRDGALWYQNLLGGMPTTLRFRGDTLVADGRLAFGQRMLWGPDLLVVAGDTLRRVPDARPLPAPERWRRLIGEYGWDHDVLYILEREGRLYALIEWFALYPLGEVSEGVFRFPDYGMYAGETVTFGRDETGRATAAAVSAVVFRRRTVGPEDGSVFRIVPRAPMEEVRRAALAATPPAQRPGLRAPDLVDLTSVDPQIRLDVRYATTDNFMGARMYSSARAFLQRPAAEALARVQRALAARGYGLLVHDGYRPWYVTRMFWDATPDAQRLFVANPARGSRHNRGCSVDIALYDLATGRPIEFVSGYDEFTARAYRDYPGGTSLQRWHRDLLRRAMEAEGFRSQDTEWWHFDWRDWTRYPVLNLTFEQLDARRH
jgi:CubicO group peptidase (beta-lactamase class C family)/D-alanyl-D-alanine dipeptidase